MIARAANDGLRGFWAGFLSSCSASERANQLLCVFRFWSRVLHVVADSDILLCCLSVVSFSSLEDCLFSMQLLAVTCRIHGLDILTNSVLHPLPSWACAEPQAGVNPPRRNPLVCPVFLFTTPTPHLIVSYLPPYYTCMCLHSVPYILPPRLAYA